MAEEKAYQLYAGNLQKLPKKIKYSYYGRQGGYMLIYTDEPIKHGFVKIEKSMYEKLRPDEKAWFLRTKAAINAEYIEEHKATYMQMTSDFLDIVETELKKEMEQGKQSV